MSLLVARLRHFRFPAHKFSRVETYKYSLFIAQQQFESFPVLQSDSLYLLCVCVCVWERLWLFVFPSGQSRYDKLQSSALPGRWSSSCWSRMFASENRLQFSCRVFKVLPGQLRETQSNIKYECLLHVFRSRSQIIDSPTIWMLFLRVFTVSLTWQAKW